MNRLLVAPLAFSMDPLLQVADHAITSLSVQFDFGSSREMSIDMTPMREGCS